MYKMTEYFINDRPYRLIAKFMILSPTEIGYRYSSRTPRSSDVAFPFLSIIIYAEKYFIEEDGIRISEWRWSEYSRRSDGDLVPYEATWETAEDLKKQIESFVQ